MAIVYKYLTDEENKIILAKEDFNNRLEELLKVQREEWDNTVTDMLAKNTSKNYTKLLISKAHDAQIEVITHIQRIGEDMVTMRQKIARAMSSRDDMKAKKSLFYKTGFDFKTTNNAETSIYVEAVLRELNREVELYSIHIDYLKDTRKNLESLKFAHQTYANFLELYGRLE